MTKSYYQALDYLFHPNSIALVGITVTNPEHWTRTFLDALIEFKFKKPLYLVNRKGGEINGRKVYKKLLDVPHPVDYVISTVPAIAAPDLVDECAKKGVKAIHFCTAGFSETGEPDKKKLEIELAKRAKKAGIRIIGPNCMGIYCPESRISFMDDFPKESGRVTGLSQSGGNARLMVYHPALRGVRFNKVVSYGNACDLNESDFLYYAAEDPSTEIIAMYIEGIKDGTRFRQALAAAAKRKPVILLKGGMTQSGARMIASHTASLAGSLTAWDAVCKQTGAILVYSIDDLIDLLVMFYYARPRKGKNVSIVGIGGGVTVLITDEFERAGLSIPMFSPDIQKRIGELISPTGNIIKNPLDCSQDVNQIENIAKTIRIIAEWEGTDTLIGFFSAGQGVIAGHEAQTNIIDTIAKEAKRTGKTGALIIESGVLPEEAARAYEQIKHCIALGIPVFSSFAAAARTLNRFAQYSERRDS